MAGDPPGYPVGSLDRGLRVIAFVRDVGAVGAMDVAALLGVSRSSAHRILRELSRAGYVTSADGRAYTAGAAMHPPRRTSLAAYAALADVARASLTSLAAELHLSTNLVVESGNEIGFVMTVPVPGGTPDRTGTSLPTHRTAGGKAMLSTIPEADLWRRYPECARDAPPASHRGLIRAVDRARRAGYATAMAEIDDGIGAVAVPLRDLRGRLLAALTASGELGSALAGRGAAHTAEVLVRAGHAIQRDLVELAL